MADVSSADLAGAFDLAEPTRPGTTLDGEQTPVDGTGRPARVLVVDDEHVIREILSDFLVMEGYQVLTAGNGREALEVLGRERCDLIISDLKMPEMGGLELLEAVRDEYPDTIMLIMTGYGTVETAIQAMKSGAFDYVLKPFKVEEVVHTVARGLAQQRLKAENIQLKSVVSLYQLAEGLEREHELQPTLGLICETVREQAHADRVSVVLFPDQDARWPGTSRGGKPITDADLTEEAIRLEQPIVAFEGRAFRYLRGSEHTADVTALMMTPLRGRSGRLGLLIAVRDGGPPFAEGQRKLLTILADRAGVAVQNAQLFETLDRSFKETIEALVSALEEKDRYTRGHSERVAEFAQVTAIELGLSEEEVELIYQSGRLHDIGKMTIRSEELNKPAGLTDEEFARFRKHPGFGEELLSKIPTFRPLLAGIGGHHEKFDGTGYPRGLKGDEIPLMARIIAVADTYDAMTSHRAYRSALKHAVAIEELKRFAGTQFCPEVVDAFSRAIEVWRDRRRAEGREYPR
jgi:response regulator RpfG family c-di-GMP phosphodiesterase